MSNFKLMEVTIIEASELIPENWKSWFWGAFSEDCPFSYGDNNRTLIDPDRFIDHIEDIREYAVTYENVHDEEIDNWIKELETIHHINNNGRQIYIDIEN